MKRKINPDTFYLETEGFWGCCGISIISGFPEGNEEAVRESYQSGAWDPKPVDAEAQLKADLTNQLLGLPTQGHVKMVTLSQRQPFAISMMRKWKWQEIGAFKNSNSDNMVYVFAIGFTRVEKTAPKKAAKAAPRKRVKREL